MTACQPMDIVQQGGRNGLGQPRSASLRSNGSTTGPPPCPPASPPPGLLFFTTYTLLVLFWAEIYQQARNLPAAALRPAFLGINVLVYTVLVGGGLPRTHGGKAANL